MVRNCPSCGYYIYNNAPTCVRCGAAVLMPMPGHCAQPYPPPQYLPPMPQCAPPPQYAPMPQCAPPPPMPCAPCPPQYALAPVAVPVQCSPRSAPRALWAFILTLVAGILVVLNAGALLSQSFYNMWVSAFFWIPAIDNSPTHGLIFVLGAIVGLVLLVGSILMVFGYGTIGSIVVFPMAVLSLIIGGGFVAGFVLGVVGGILGMLGR